MYRFRRHSLPIQAHLRRSVALAYAAPEGLLQPLLGPGLELDTFEGFGFLVVALVQTENLRIKGFPKWAGVSFFLSGYRLFVRYSSPAGKHLRGLKILRSETDSKLLKFGGNLLTHYGYRLVESEVAVNEEQIEIDVRANGKSNLTLSGNFSRPVLPADSIFGTEKQARSFAGPMPFTFDYERETNSMISVQGVRSGWTPSLFEAEIKVPPEFSEFGLSAKDLVLASAFHVEDVPYTWKRGTREPLP